MGTRHTIQDVRVAFAAYSRTLKGAGVDHPGHALTLIEGSKTYGNSYKVVWVKDGSGGHVNAPGTDFGGFIGWTKKEAATTLWMMHRLLVDVQFHKQRQVSDH